MYVCMYVCVCVCVCVLFVCKSFEGNILNVFELMCLLSEMLSSIAI